MKQEVIIIGAGLSGLSCARQLQLRPFLSGASVRYNGHFYQLADPWRRPWTALTSAFTPIGTLADKLRIARLRSQSLAGTYQQRMQSSAVLGSEIGQRPRLFLEACYLSR